MSIYRYSLNKGCVMKIQQSEVTLLSSHHKKSEVYEKESLEVWNKDKDAPERFK